MVTYLASKEIIIGSFPTTRDGNEVRVRVKKTESNQFVIDIRVFYKDNPSRQGFVITSDTAIDMAQLLNNAVEAIMEADNE